MTNMTPPAAAAADHAHVQELGEESSVWFKLSALARGEADNDAPADGVASATAR